MNKEFVPSQESLELKELGFDEPCFGWYSNMAGNVFRQGYCETYLGIENCVKTPTFSQALRWFREMHGLVIVIKPIADKRLELGYNLTKNGLIMGAYTTYEKAELACLKKLIELVK